MLSWLVCMVLIIIKLSTLEQDDDGYKLLQMYVFCHYLIKILHLYPYSFRLISLYDYSLLIYVCLPRKCSVAASSINHSVFFLLLFMSSSFQKLIPKTKMLLRLLWNRFIIITFGTTSRMKIKHGNSLKQQQQKKCYVLCFVRFLAVFSPNPRIKSLLIINDFFLCYISMKISDDDKTFWSCCE